MMTKNTAVGVFQVIQSAVHRLVKYISDNVQQSYLFHHSNKTSFQRVILEPVYPEADLPTISAGDNICFEFDGQLYLGEILDVHQGEYTLPPLLFHRPIRPCLLKHRPDGKNQSVECNQGDSMCSPHYGLSCPVMNYFQSRNEYSVVNKKVPCDDVLQSSSLQRQDAQSNLLDTNTPRRTIQETPKHQLYPVSKAYRKVIIVLHRLSKTIQGGTTKIQ